MEQHLDAVEQIREFEALLENMYLDKILTAQRKDASRVVVDFADVAKHDVELANLLIEHPEEVIRAAELAVEPLIDEKNKGKFKVRFKNLPKSQELMIRHVRAKHIGQLFSFIGVVRQKSDVRPQVTSARFECPSCGNIIAILQLDKKFKEPSKCNCGRKGKFHLLSKDLIDAQGIVLEEAPEDLDGGEQPKRMNVLLKDDLVSPITEKQTNPGSKILVNGLVKEVPVLARDGGKLTRFDLIIEANYVEALQEDVLQLEISPEEEKKIRDIANDPRGYDRLIKSLAPSIYGHDRIKEALILQVAGGVRKKRSDGSVTRGDMHVLLIGDPGSGKSMLLKRVSSIAPKGRYTSGKGVSGAGLVAAVVRDEFLGGWSLEAGAMVLANRGFLMIDEMDKMSAEDTSALHEALEQQTASISKANIQATLRCETTVLAAANPKFGRFDPYDILAKQIDMPPALINRFDLIFPVKDLPDQTKDERLAQHVLELHKDPDFDEPEIDSNMLKKYIAYVRQHCNPRLGLEAMQEIKQFYVELRNKSQPDEGGIRAVPISARQLEALVRMAEASARIHLRENVTVEDARKAIDLMYHCLSQVGLDPETGKIDIDRIATGIGASQRTSINQIKQIITDLEERVGKTIPIDDVINEAKEKGIPENIVEETIERLKRTGDLFEPKHGWISKL